VDLDLDLDHHYLEVLCSSLVIIVLNGNMQELACYNCLANAVSPPIIMTYCLSIFDFKSTITLTTKQILQFHSRHAEVV
jgi:hypothetical protein